MTDNDSGVWHDQLQCHLLRTEVHVHDRLVKFLLPKYNCTDMSGAVDTALLMLPTVRFIETWSAGELDTCYFIEHGDKDAIWYAMPSPRHVGHRIAWHMFRHAQMLSHLEDVAERLITADTPLILVTTRGDDASGYKPKKVKE